MKKEVAVSVVGLNKSFKLPHLKINSIKSLFLNVFSKKNGYEKQVVLNNLSFDIKEGEFFGIVGRNGSGKSTLLKLLAGIYSPDFGKVTVNGKLTPFIELGVGFSPELSGRDNVFLNGSLLGFSRKEIELMYDEIVEFAELEKFMDQKVKNYSSGMQVRLAFSVAIKAKSDILLIDEVLAVGDQSFQEKCFKYFNDLKKSNRTVILVTHDMSNVEKYCDRALIIDKALPEAKVVNVEEAVATYNRLNYEKFSYDRTQLNKNNDIYIKKVEILDGSLKRTKEIFHNDEIVLRVYLDSNKEIEKSKQIVIGLAFYDQDGVNLSGPNSTSEKFTISDKVIEYRVKKIPFAKGRYRIAIGIFDQYVKQHFDFMDNAGTFYVNSTKTIYGKVSLEGSWEAIRKI